VKKDKQGYILIFCPDHPYSETRKGWILEHRVVVENFIKRKLRTGECIHHIDKNKKNNDIKNLMVFQSHKAHASWHNKLKRYGYPTTPMRVEVVNRWEKLKEIDRMKK